MWKFTLLLGLMVTILGCTGSAGLQVEADAPDAATFAEGEATALVKTWLSQMPWSPPDDEANQTSTCLHYHQTESVREFREAKLSDGIWIVTHETDFGVHKWWVYELSHAIDPKEGPDEMRLAC